MNSKPPSTDPLTKLFREIECKAFLERRAWSTIIRIEPWNGAFTPVVPGELLFSKNGWWITGVEILCPWCGAFHSHGAGPLPGDGDGHRVAHCNAQPRINTGYIIRERRMSERELQQVGFRPDYRHPLPRRRA
ncbi:MAG: hypothetical protein M3Z05_15425 [Gemmatimonadota bacterium]|nr:hypothetical protein [Gemmatimonadota bacterium]